MTHLSGEGRAVVKMSLHALPNTAHRRYVSKCHDVTQLARNPETRSGQHYCQKLGAAHHHHHTSSLRPVALFLLFFQICALYHVRIGQAYSGELLN